MLTIFRTNKDKNSSNEPIRKPSVAQPTPMPDRLNHPPVPDKPIQAPKPSRQVAQPARPVIGATTIGKDLVFEGNVTGKGSIRVEGEFIGKLEVKNEVIIGKGGVVKGNIQAEIVTVEGQLTGNVTARQKININVTGTMIGDIIAPRVVVASGAVYKGRIDMKAALGMKDVAKKESDKPANTDKKQTQNTPKTIPGPPPKN